MNAVSHQTLAAALGGGELVVHYQPIVDARTAAPRAGESLARWRTGEGELRGANWLFGRIGGDPALMQLIDRAVVARVLEDRAAVPQLGALKLSINRDAQSVSLEDIRSFVDSCAGRDGVPVAVEFFEHLSPTQLELMPAIAEELADAGIEVWHDDFGTGERALDHLIALPSTVVKLCPELAAQGVASARARRHVRSVIAMLHNLGKVVIAEGVVDAAEAEWLGDAGVDWFQGWHYARPMVALEAAAWLNAQEQRAA
jgi:EAL domain-containing protein (putative c-di-GMP-specific phosphodiesterase class I)